MINKELLKEALGVIFEPGGFCLSAVSAIAILILIKIIVIIVK